MTRAMQWRDALGAADRLGDADWRILLLLLRLPFLPAEVLLQLLGLAASSPLYEQIKRLEALGLVDAIHPSLQPRRSPRLFYVTDFGLVTVALHRDVRPSDLAAKLKLRPTDLLGQIEGLPQLVATYRLLGGVAASRPGQPTLLAWRRPWRGQYYRPSDKDAVRVRLPAYAAVTWNGESREHLLIPDLGTFPPRLYARALAHLLVLRQLQEGNLPRLVIATTHAKRVGVWEKLLDNAAEKRLDERFAAWVATWEDLPKGLTQLAELEGDVPARAANLIQSISLARLASKPPSRPIHPLTQDALTVTGLPTADEGLNRRALALTSTERTLLDFIGRHPFLTLDDTAAVMEWQPERARAQRNRLIRLGLLRLLELGEIDGLAGPDDLVELTGDGLALVAAHQGLSVARAVRHNGLVGGGVEHATLVRRKLLQNLAHTLGVNAIFASLYRTAAERRERGHDDAVVEWRSPALCSSRLIRPDGYAIYRHDGTQHGFFLEYDRGTMSMAQYYAKFAAYYTYMQRDLFARDYNGMPTILVVTMDLTAERRIARAVSQISEGRDVQLRVWLTCEWRLQNARNADRLIDRIWWARDGNASQRRRWPSGAS
ncbi:MAG: replication-relaxation family protein [Anaerolineae bacterium]